MKVRITRNLGNEFDIDLMENEEVDLDEDDELGAALLKRGLAEIVDPPRRKKTAKRVKKVTTEAKQPALKAVPPDTESTQKE